MKLKSFQANNPNPFTDHISDEEFEYMIGEGFGRGKLDCYAPLNGDICYRKNLRSSLGCIINIYITENGIAVDQDYDCGGNSSNWTWLFGTMPTQDDPFNRPFGENGVLKDNKSFGEAWNEMVELSTSL